jgi:hypothetical protein
MKIKSLKDFYIPRGVGRVRSKIYWSVKRSFMVDRELSYDELFFEVEFIGLSFFSKPNL